MRVKDVWLGLMMLAAVHTTAFGAESAAQLAPTHGYVFASLPGAEPADTLVLRSLKDDSKYTLPKRADADGNTIGMWLPAGDYKLYLWRELFMAPYPPVSVAAGRVTDLGSVAHVPVGNNDVVLLPLHNAETARNTAVVLAEFQSVLQNRETLEWRTSKVPTPFRLQEGAGKNFGLIPDLLALYENRTNAAPISKALREAVAVDDFLRLAKAAAAPLTQKPVQDAQGRMFFGATLGQVRVRDASGAWSTLDTGSLHTVTAVESRGALLLAGFDNGLVRISEDGGKTWKLAATLDKDTAVVDISRFGEQWLLTTAHGVTLRSGLRSVDKMTVYSARANDLSDITKNREFATETEPLIRPHAEVFKNFYYVNAFPKLWQLDATSMQWRAVGPDTEVHGFQIAPDNGTLAAYRIKGGFSRLFVSTDNASTWTKYDNPPYVIMDIRFANATQGQAVRWNTGAFSGTIELLQYDRSKDSWTKTAEAPQGCLRILPDAAQNPKLCVTRGANILSYGDGKWVAEFAVD